jgi:hypothetical protein
MVTIGQYDAARVDRLAASITLPLMTSRRARTRAIPYRSKWCWVQFTCAFVFVGFVTFLHVGPPFDGLGAHLTWTGVVAATGGYFAGRFGDSAWEVIVTLLCFL